MYELVSEGKKEITLNKKIKNPWCVSADYPSYLEEQKSQMR